MIVASRALTKASRAFLKECLVYTNCCLKFALLDYWLASEGAAILNLNLKQDFKEFAV